MSDHPFRPPETLSDQEPTGLPTGELDPVYKHAVHEGRIILGVWAVGLIWSMGVCGTLAYRNPGDVVPITFGVPSWVFWGIAFPWVMASLFSVWFSLFYMKNDDLGATTEDNLAPDSASADGEGQNV